MKYEFAPDIQETAEEISSLLFPHVKTERLRCFRSYGTSSRRTIARCHALNKLMQKALRTKAVYVLEFLSERFDKLSKKEQLKVLIHELLHIPNCFGGGFKHHNFVTDKNVSAYYKEYEKRKWKNES